MIGGIEMILVLKTVFLFVIVHLCYQFIRLLVKMKKAKIFPITNEELVAIRTNPQKGVNLPTFSKQKLGIIVYSILLLFLIGLYITSVFLKDLDVSFYLLVLFPLSVSYNTHSYSLLNLFAIDDDGILNGARFVPWKRMKSFRFERIDVNHRYYGYSKEVNDGYELIVETKFSKISCIVTTDDSKEKLGKILCEHGLLEGVKSAKIVGKTENNYLKNEK